MMEEEGTTGLVRESNFDQSKTLLYCYTSGRTEVPAGIGSFSLPVECDLLTASYVVAAKVRINTRNGNISQIAVVIPGQLNFSVSDKWFVGNTYSCTPMYGSVERGLYLRSNAEI